MKKNSNTDQVYKALTKRLNMTEETAKCFALFELVDYNFGNETAAINQQSWDVYTIRSRTKDSTE